MVGINEGDELGNDVGNVVGINEGDELGNDVGTVVGINEGDELGNDVGNMVGINEGDELGNTVGTIVGINEGDELGNDVGNMVGFTEGDELGNVVCGMVWGWVVGTTDGTKVAGLTDGKNEGCWEGLLVLVLASNVTQRNLLDVHGHGPPPFSNPLVLSQLQPKPWLLGDPWLLPDFQLSQVAPDLVVQSLFIPDAWFIQVDVIALVKGNVMKPNESVWPI